MTVVTILSKLNFIFLFMKILKSKAKKLAVTTFNFLGYEV